METTEDPSVLAIVGASPQMIDLKAAILKIAPRNTTVLITGETGTGKEMFAQAIYHGSLRRYKPFVRVNCAAIPESLLESELFGYADGTFTGGRRGGYLGKFAQADGGTVFLDEVAELPLPIQAKLLRFIQEKEIQRLGESQPRRLNVRLVAATNANLGQLVKYNKFRSDLYYRLNVVTLEIPPLRDRREDIIPLCRQFMRQLNQEFDYRIYRLSPEVLRLFNAYSWPGNVRELQNVLEVAYNLSAGGPELRMEHMAKYLKEWMQEQDNQKILAAKAKTGEYTPAADLDQPALKPGPDDQATIQAAVGNLPPGEFRTWQEYLNLVGKRPLGEIMDALEEELLRYLLRHQHNRSQVAGLLGISRPALYKKMQKYSLSGESEG